jgi:arylsulfatase A-like enzyme
MDFLPTFARLAGTQAPADRIIDGKDITPLLRGESGAAAPHEAFFYFICDDLEAVRVGQWKLHVSKRGEAMTELYDLEKDIGESANVAKQHPDVVKTLQARLDNCRADIGDALAGAEGANCRPIGRVQSPRPLTEYNPNHPYIIAMYDLKEAG